MSTTGGNQEHVKAMIGSKTSFWLYDSKTGYDLTHPATPDSAPIKPRVTIQTSTSPVTVDPAKSALVIIDMQNFFLSETMGRKRGAGHEAQERLIQYAIPAARKAHIRVLWVNWGLTDQEVDEIPPNVAKTFGFEGDVAAGDTGSVDQYYTGMGRSCGKLTDSKTGKQFDAGLKLMRDQWNSALHPPLDRVFEEGKQLEKTPDVWIHKNRMSGMWGPKTLMEEYLEQQGIKTLLFAGVNTDQCVGGTLQDSFSKGYDTILLKDGCGTTSPSFAQEAIEFNCKRGWGFLTSCNDLSTGVENMQKQ